MSEVARKSPSGAIPPSTMTSAPALNVSGTVPSKSTHSVFAGEAWSSSLNLTVRPSCERERPASATVPNQAGRLQLVRGGGKRFGNVEKVDAVFGKARIREITHASQKQEKRPRGTCSCRIFSSLLRPVSPSSLPWAAAYQRQRKKSNRKLILHG